MGAQAIGVAPGAILLAFATTTCGNEPTASCRPSTLTSVSGNEKRGAAGQPLAGPLVVKVADATGAGCSGATVEWSVVTGGGSLSASRTATDASGLASAIWTLGPHAGSNTASAVVAGLPQLSFTATALGAPVTLIKVSGDSQSAPAGQVLPNPLVVRVADASAVGVPGIAVRWSIESGGASLSADTGTTDSLGQASVVWMLPPFAGSRSTVSASATGLSTVTFTATTTPLPPAKAAFSTLLAAAWAGSAMLPFTVAIVDALGYTVYAASDTVVVALGANPGDGTLSGATAARAVHGVATFTALSIDKPASGYTLAATVAGLSGATSATFDILAVPGGFRSIAAGANHTCGVTSDGEAACWGDNELGQLGTGSIDLGFDRAVPVAGSLEFQSLSASAAHTCGVAAGGAAYCWGDGTSGQLGTGAPMLCGPGMALGCRPTPGPVDQGSLTFAAVVGGGRAETCWYDHYGFHCSGGMFTCGVTSTGALYCWGSISGGIALVRVDGGLTFRSISAGGRGLCGVTTDGAAYCGYGLSDTGQPIPFSFAAISGGLTFQSVSGGGSHACGVTITGAAYCWGDNSAGQLGTGSITSSTTPVAVSGGLTFAEVSTGASHTCGVTTGGAAYCWGNNADGELGDGTTTSSTIPVPVAGGLTFGSVSAGGFHTCGVTTGGAAYCWGRNDVGQLGDGSTTDSPTPVPVTP